MLVRVVPAIAAEALDLHGRLDEVGAGGPQAARQPGERGLVVQLGGALADLAHQEERMVHHEQVRALLDQLPAGTKSETLFGVFTRGLEDQTRTFRFFASLVPALWTRTIMVTF